MIKFIRDFSRYIAKPGSMLSDSLHKKHFAKSLNIENMRGVSLMFSRVSFSLYKSHLKPLICLCCYRGYFNKREKSLMVRKKESCGKEIRKFLDTAFQ